MLVANVVREQFNMDEEEPDFLGMSAYLCSVKCITAKPICRATQMIDT